MKLFVCLNAIFRTQELGQRPQICHVPGLLVVIVRHHYITNAPVKIKHLSAFGHSLAMTRPDVWITVFSVPVLPSHPSVENERKVNYMVITWGSQLKAHVIWTSLVFMHVFLLLVCRTILRDMTYSSYASHPA